MFNEPTKIMQIKNLYRTIQTFQNIKLLKQIYKHRQ
jgi:hypothetical protein